MNLLKKYSGQVLIQSGQTLVEVLVAMTVGVLVLTAITSSVLTSIVNSRVIGLSGQATQFAQEGIEIARASRNAASGTYCLDKGETVLTGIPEGACTTPNVGSTYIRTVSVLGNQAGNDCGAGINKTIVSVKWTDAKCANGSYCHQITLNSCANVIVAAGTITPTPTVTPTPIPQVDTYPDYADATIDSNSPTSNDGTSTIIDGENTNSFLLKFDTAPLAGRILVDATLQLSARLGGNVFNISDAGNEWFEKFVTYNNRPPIGALLGSGTSDETSNHFLSVDVTGRLRDNLGYPVSFYGKEPIYSNDFINAREGGTTTEPKLTIRTNAGTQSLSVPSVGSSSSSSCTSCSSLTYSHSSTGVGSMLLVSLSFEGVDSLVTGVTYGAINLTKIDKTVDTRDNVRTQMWYLFSPPGGTSNIVITLSSPSTAILSTAATIVNTATQYSLVDSQSNWTQSGSPLSTPSVYAYTSDLIVSAHGVDCGTSISTLTPLVGQTAPTPAVLLTDKGHILTTKPGPSSTVGASWTGSVCSYGSAIAVSLRGLVN